MLSRSSNLERGGRRSFGNAAKKKSSGNWRRSIYMWRLSSFLLLLGLAQFFLIGILHRGNDFAIPLHLRHPAQGFLSLMRNPPTLTSDTPAWPPKLGFCTTGGWPVEVILTSDDTPVQMFVYETEKVKDNDKLSFLIAAVSDEKDVSTATLLKKVLPSMRCDFRVGDESWNAYRGPVHRSTADISILATGDKKASVVVRLTCDLPPPTLLNVEDPSLVAPRLLRASKLVDIGHKLQAQKDSHKWLHWQLSLPHLQSQSDAVKGRSWLAAPSIPICDLTQGMQENLFWADRMPSADDYGPRTENATNKPVESVSAALCVAPPMSTSVSTYGEWMNSSISKWIYYQRRIVGFTAIFYLDPFGEDLVVRHPEVSRSLGSGLLHVPHLAVRSSFRKGDTLNMGKVATTLAHERCSVLARQSNIDYTLMVTDPMNLLVPLQRRAMLLPQALASVTEKDCAKSVQVSSMTWTMKDANDGCIDAWCDLPDATDPVSSFLLAGPPAKLIEESQSSFYNSSTHSYCRKTALLPKESFRMISARLESTAHGNTQHELESMNAIVQGVATWVRHDIQLGNKVKERALKIRRDTLSSGSSWIPVSLTDESMHLRSCRDFTDKGPQFGEAIILKKTPSSNLSPHVVLRLSFYNAETVTSPTTGLRALSLSVYAESIKSIDHSLSQGWGLLLQSNSVKDVLPNASCVFTHPDPIQRALTTPQEIRTYGKWLNMDDMIWWLECPLPDRLPSQDVFDVASFVAIEPAESSPLEWDLEFHMARPVHLCFGTEKKGDFCDFVSVACKVGCIDDLKIESDPQARCCDRCHEDHHSYRRFDERDFWMPKMLPANNLKDSLPNKSGDLSICLRPFFMETMSRENNNIDPSSPQRLFEWLEYHFLIGFDVIYVLDRYGTSLLPLLEPYVSAGRVIHVPFPFLSDVALSWKARSRTTPFVPSAHDQVIAYDLCLSIARRRNDLYTAFVDLDEFIRYPEAEAGRLRTSIDELLDTHWVNRTDLPDAIYLDRFDVETEPEGFALQYKTRFLEHRFEVKMRDGHWTANHDLADPTSKERRSHGKAIASPQAHIYGGVTIHSTTTLKFATGGDKISIFHYRPYNKQKEAGDMQKGKKAEDKSLQWAHDILCSQFIGSSIWRNMKALSKQGLIQIKSLQSTSLNHVRPASSSDKRPTLFIGILSYCKDRDRRDAIRATWLSSGALRESKQLLNVQWKFILGQAPSSEQSTHCQKPNLFAEKSEFGDLVFFSDLPESYQVLTRKTLAIFKWANDSIDADFVLKVDDDTYVNILEFASDISQIETPELPLYWGSQLILNPWLTADFDLAPKWYTKPEDYPSDVQMYATGAGYLLSRPLVRHLVGMLDRHGNALLPWGPEERMGWLEDASIGYLLRGAVNRAGRVKATGIYDTWFWDEMKCHTANFIVHHVQSAQQLELHSLLFPTKELTGAACRELRSFGVDPPIAKPGEKAKAASWGGSFLDRPVSPLNIAEPPPVKDSFVQNEPAATAGNTDRDVVVVTGGLNNIGRHLVENLQQGYSRMSGPVTILVLDSAAETGVKGGQSPIGVRTIVRNVDITNFEALRTALAAYEGRIRGVVHLAAISRVQDCHSNATRCEEVNVGGTKNILNILWTLHGRYAVITTSSSRPADKSPRPWLVFASSREVYGGLSPDEVVTEASPVRPLNVYGETKLQAENAIRQWTIKAGFNSVVLRFVNVYGSCHDHKSRLVPNLMEKLSSDIPFDIFESADKTISLLHVDDAVQSLILSFGYADRLQNGAGYFEPFNIGGGPKHDVLNMRDIVSMAQSTVLASSQKCKFCLRTSDSRVLRGKVVEDRSVEPEHFRASIDKAFRVLGYYPSRSFNAETLSKYFKECIQSRPRNKS